MSSQMSFSSTNSTSVGTQSSSEPLPFLVAEYEGQKFTVLRSISYQSTIASLKRNIASLQETLDDHIFILAILPGVCDYVRITKDVWASLCDKLTVVRVEQDTYDWSKSSKRERSPEIRTDKKRAKYNRPSSDQGLPVGENAVAESSQVSARAMRDCRESHGGQFSNIEHGSPWGGGKNIGQMKFNKRRTKRGPNLKPSTWSYSNDGLDRFSPNHRAEGDVHLSPKHSDSDSFDHWVCRIVRGRKSWYRVLGKEPHPSLRNYVLREGTVRLPPKWVLPGTLRCAEYRLNRDLDLY